MLRHVPNAAEWIQTAGSKSPEGKVNPSNRPRALRSITSGFAVVACAGFAFLIYSGIASNGGRRRIGEEC
jgi:hypothetical protein